MVSVLSPLLQNLSPLPSSELTDPHDDVTLPRLIEALQHRHRIKRMMFDEYGRAGTCTQLSASNDAGQNVEILLVLTRVVFFKPTHLSPCFSNWTTTKLPKKALLRNKKIICQAWKESSRATRQRSNVWRRGQRCMNTRYKTKAKSSVNLWIIGVNLLFLPKENGFFFYRLTSCRKRLKSTRTRSAHCTTSWEPESRSCSGSCLTRDAWSSACTERSQTCSSSGRKNA